MYKNAPLSEDKIMWRTEIIIELQEFMYISHEKLELGPYFVILT